MFVNTSQAAKILGISTSRVRQLLLDDRIEGATKLGRIWIIPLFNDKIIVQKREKGPKSKWSSHRPPAKTRIHINTQNIKQNNQKIRESLDNKEQKRTSQFCTLHFKLALSKTELPLVYSIALQKWEAAKLNSVISVKKGDRNLYCDEIKIKGYCRIVYLPYTKNPGGAKVLLETFSEVEMFGEVPQLTLLKLGLPQLKS